MVTNAMRSNNEGLPKQAKKCAGKRQKLVEVGPFQIAARRNGGDARARDAQIDDFDARREGAFAIAVSCPSVKMALAPTLRDTIFSYFVYRVEKTIVDGRNDAENGNRSQSESSAPRDNSGLKSSAPRDWRGGKAETQGPR